MPEDIDYAIGNTTEKITKLSEAKALLLETLAYLKDPSGSEVKFPYIMSIKLEGALFGQPIREDKRSSEINLQGLGIKLDEQFIMYTVAKIDAIVDEKRRDLSGHYDIKIAQLQASKKKLEKLS